MDDEFVEQVRETRVAMDVVVEQLSKLQLSLVEQSVALEKVLALQKDLLKREGKSAQEIEAQLRAIDRECRVRVLERFAAGDRRVGEPPIGDGHNPSKN